MLDNWGLILNRDREGNFSLLHHVDMTSKAHIYSYPLIMGALSLGVEQCDYDPSPPFAA
jgi:hypothetical protein